MAGWDDNFASTRTVGKRPANVLNQCREAALQRISGLYGALLYNGWDYAPANVPTITEAAEGLNETPVMAQINAAIAWLVEPQYSFGNNAARPFYCDHLTGPVSDDYYPFGAILSGTTVGARYTPHPILTWPRLLQKIGQHGQTHAAIGAGSVTSIRADGFTAAPPAQGTLWITRYHVLGDLSLEGVLSTSFYYDSVTENAAGDYTFNNSGAGVSVPAIPENTPCGFLDLPVTALALRGRKLSAQAWQASQLLNKLRAVDVVNTGLERRLRTSGTKVAWATAVSNYNAASWGSWGQGGDAAEHSVNGSSSGGWKYTIIRRQLRIPLRTRQAAAPVTTLEPDMDVWVISRAGGSLYENNDFAATETKLFKCLANVSVNGTDDGYEIFPTTEEGVTATERLVQLYGWRTPGSSGGWECHQVFKFDGSDGFTFKDW
jgi:hypothetical protein